MEDTSEIIKWSVGSGFLGTVLTIVVGKLLGKKKEEIEIALNYQKYYKNHIDDLTNQLAEVKGMLAKALEEHKEDKINWERIDKERAFNLKRWEESHLRVESMYKEERALRMKLQEQLENNED